MKHLSSVPLIGELRELPLGIIYSDVLFFKSYCRDNKIIEVCATNIKKIFTNPHESDVEKLKNVYSKLGKKNVPNVDRLIHADNLSGVVYLEPKRSEFKAK
jgi:hypothetical protein